MKNGRTDRDLIFEGKRQKALEKKLGYKFTRSNTSKEGYDADYEASRIQPFISKFKDRQLKKIKQKIKKTRRQNRKIDRSNHSIKSKWFFQITKTCICFVKTVKNIHVTRFQKN